MPQRGRPADLSKVKTYSIRKRQSKLDTSQLAKVPDVKASLGDFISTLPRTFKAEELLKIAEAILRASQRDRLIVWMMGAHPIKCGLSPILIRMMEEKFINVLALNGAGAIHDFELAFFGHTSEDVEKGLTNGSFGMARETGEGINQFINDGVKRGFGIGESLGRGIFARAPRYVDYSLLAHGAAQHIPVTVHIAIGTDIIHQHPSANGAAMGKGSMRDFQLLAGQLPELNDGGVVVNCGSAVVLPEVFLKALTVARNLGSTIKNFTAVNLDMIQHYRPNTNVLARPTKDGGKSYSITGHHEIILPLLYAAIQSLKS